MPSAHPLDRPVWSALTTRQAHLSLGDARARRFAPDYGLFVAAPDASPESLAALGALVPAGGRAATLEAEPIPPLAGLYVEPRAGVQMVAQRPDLTAPAFAFARLTDADAPRMLALATLTEPGPFFARTHQLGDFFGVKRDGALVAMAGERMKPEGFTEVSGVCTHPDHRGRGYAGGLMRVVMAGILARGETPFLHAYAHNTGAIALYETLGFEVRRTVTMTMLSRG